MSNRTGSIPHVLIGRDNGWSPLYVVTNAMGTGASARQRITGELNGPGGAAVELVAWVDWAYHQTRTGFRQSLMWAMVLTLPRTVAAGEFVDFPSTTNVSGEFAHTGITSGGTQVQRGTGYEDVLLYTFEDHPSRLVRTGNDEPLTASTWHLFVHPENHDVERDLADTPTRFENVKGHRDIALPLTFVNRPSNGGMVRRLTFTEEWAAAGVTRATGSCGGELVSSQFRAHTSPGDFRRRGDGASVVAYSGVGIDHLVGVDGAPRPIG